MTKAIYSADWFWIDFGPRLTAQATFELVVKSRIYRRRGYRQTLVICPLYTVSIGLQTRDNSHIGILTQVVVHVAYALEGVPVFGNYKCAFIGFTTKMSKSLRRRLSIRSRRHKARKPRPNCGRN